MTLVGLFAAGMVHAQADHVKSSGQLSDTDLYKLVACGAPVGGKCQVRPVKWNARDAQRLTVGIVSVEPGIRSSYMRKSRKSLTQAIAEINAAGSAIRMTEVSEETPMIRIFMVNTKDKLLFETGEDWNQNVHAYSAAAYFQLDIKGSRIRGCEIRVGTDMPTAGVRRLFLEEIVQCLGLPFDVLNDYYVSRSIFSEIGFRVNRLRGQDATLLRMHYPRGG